MIGRRWSRTLLLLTAVAAAAPWGASFAQVREVWCDADSPYDSGHPLAWPQLQDEVQARLEAGRIRAAYGIVRDALARRLAARRPAAEAAQKLNRVSAAADAYIQFIEQPGREAPVLFDLGRPVPTTQGPQLKAQLGPLSAQPGAPVAAEYILRLPCTALAEPGDPVLRDTAYFLDSMHQVASSDLGAAQVAAAARATAVYQSYEDLLTNGLPMWPWEMWVNSHKIPDDFNRAAPDTQWVFLRPNLAPVLVTGGDEDAELDLGLTVEIGHIWYRNADYSKWWGVSAMVAVTDDAGIGYGGMLRWNDYTLGVAAQDGEEDVAFYLSVDLYRLVLGERGQTNSAEDFLDGLLQHVKGRLTERQ